MTDRELMQMALDALENYMAGNLGGVWDAREASDALRDRLAQPEPEPVAWMFQHQDTGNLTFFDNLTMTKLFGETNGRWGNAIPLYTQPTCQKNRHLADNATTEPFAWCHEKAGGYRFYSWNKQYPDDIPLYTTPPKREWVGLTNEEIWEMEEYKQALTDEETRFLYRFAKTIQAKLKEKNT